MPRTFQTCMTIRFVKKKQEPHGNRTIFRAFLKNLNHPYVVPKHKQNCAHAAIFPPRCTLHTPHWRQPHTTTHAGVDRTSKYKQQLTPEEFSLSFWWDKKLPRASAASPCLMWHTADIDRTLLWAKCLSALHLYQGNHGVLIRNTELKSWVVIKAKQENKVWHEPLHNKMDNLIDILGHTKNRDLAHAPFSTHMGAVPQAEMGGDPVQCMHTCSKGLLVGI